MRQSHDQQLTPEQIQELATGQVKMVEKQKEAKRLLDDHALRVRCVEQAIRSIDALPDRHIHVGDSKQPISYNVNAPDVAVIAKSIYEFVNEPLAQLDK